MKRFGQIEELGNLILLLQSDGCDYITGEQSRSMAAIICGPSTFASLSNLSDADWKVIREHSQAASAKSKAQRSA